MEIFALIVVFILIIVLFRRTSRLRVELEEANRYIRMLRERTSSVAVLPEAEPPHVVESKEATPEVPDLHWIETSPLEIAEPSVALAASEQSAAQKPEPRVENSTTRYFKSESWKRSERFILENLTGILGTLGVVLGLGFLGVYTALMLEPVYRVILLAAVSIVIAGISGYFLNIGKWRGLAQWTQSSAFAVFLLACLGSGGIPGLQWISDPMLAWGLLSTGVVANLGLAVVRRSPVFASVHAVLALAALAVAGPSPIIVATMSVLAVGSLLLIRGRDWELHLAITESVYVGILVMFYFNGAEVSEALRIVATSGLVVVFIVGQATHYRKVLAGTSWNTSAALTHLLVWCLTCAGLFLYAPQYEQLLAPCLFVVSIVVGLVARLARRRGILWLYKIDTLFSLASAFGGALSLVAWQLALTPAVLLSLVVALAFTLLMILEGEILLARIGTRATEILSLVVAGLSVSGADAIALSIAALLIGVFQANVVHRLKALEAPRSLYDLLVPWLVVIAALVLPNGQITYGLPAGYGLILPLVGLFVWHRVRSSKLLNLGLLTASVGFSLIQWGKLLFGMLFGAQDWLFSLIVSVPLVLIPLAGVLVSKSADRELRRPLVWSFGVNLALAALFVLWSVFPGLIPIAWLVFGIALIWTPTIKDNKLAEELSTVGLFLVLGGLLIYVPLVLGGLVPSAAVPLRWAIEGIVVVLLLGTYWTRSIRKPTDSETLDNVPPLFLEASLVVVLVTVFFEVPPAQLPAIIASLSTLLLVFTFFRKTQQRLMVHSCFGFLLSTLLMIWVAVTRIGGPDLWLTAIVQTVWLSLIFNVKRPSGKDFPSLLHWLDQTSTPVLNRLSFSTVIPLGIAWALSLAFTFDSTLLTLLWSLEAFGIFSLALILKEPLFRFLSLTALGVCLVRLVFFDLVQADTLSRALVFLGVGILLILMNVLYIRFKSRVSSARTDK